MKSKGKVILAIISVILFLGSATGLILTLSATGATSEDPKLQVDLFVRPEVVTAAYKIYGDNSQSMWLANTKIKNVGSVPVKNFTISYKIEGYCDWTSTENYPLIVPGETVRDYCWPTFDAAKMRSITTKTPAELTLRYEYEGCSRPIEKTEKFFFLGKNDFVWTDLKEEDILTFQDENDNYPLLAAFVTKNDPTTQAWAKSITGGLAPGTDQDTYECLVRAFYALRNAGIKYVYEPELVESKRFGQYIQYPSDTLGRMAGTCLDLAILFDALMEAVSVRSYIILIPGHAIPAVLLPESGEILPIESTFMDVDFVLTHYPGLTSSQVTAEECINISIDIVNKNIDEGTCIIVDIQEQWENGVVPTW